jgi:phosphonopyruvate decarboxylase
MIDPAQFIGALNRNQIDFICGVPDSLMKGFCNYACNTLDQKHHQITANEGSAVGLAIGHYLSTGRMSLVYMQNSGLGNCLNPLISLADKRVYGIPMLLMIGWRAEMKQDGDQASDEPQHIRQGQLTVEQLELMGMPYEILGPDTDFEAKINSLTAKAVEDSIPVALIIRKEAFEKTSLESEDESWALTREQAIGSILENLPSEVPIVSTTGMTSRELFEIREKRDMGTHRDFLCVGGMGHASQIAAGVARNLSNDKKILCLDGDGAVAMHMGGLATNANIGNLIHLVLNNGRHDSVGGQPNILAGLKLSEIAEKMGYGLACRVENNSEIAKCINEALKSETSCFVEVMCKSGARKDLGRPTKTPQQNKQNFMKFIEDIS